MNKLTVMLLCLMLCFAEIGVPSASAAVLTSSARTALVACLQQEYLMRDVYQDLFAAHPALPVLDIVAVDEATMILALKKACARHKVAVPADAQVSAARSMADSVSSVSMADTMAINLEKTTATLMGRLLQTTRSSDVMSIEALIRSICRRSGRHVGSRTSSGDRRSACRVLLDEGHDIDVYGLPS